MLNREERRAWLAERRQGVGASDAAIILGVSPWKSPLALFTEKMNLAGNDDDSELTEYQKWGMRLEDAVATGFGEETGRAIIRPANPFVIDRHPEYPFMQATLDRRQELVDGSELPPFVIPPGHEKPVLECKTTALFKADEWEEEPPLHYQVQLQHQLFVTGAAWGSLAVLIGGQVFRYKDMPRNDAFIRLLLRRCQEFWQHVQAGVPPPPDGHESTKEALHRLFPRAADPTPIELPAEAIEWDAQLQDAKERIKAAEADKLLAENRIKAAIGEHLAGVTPAGITYQWKVEPKGAYTVAASEPRVLRRKEPKQKGNR